MKLSPRTLTLIKYTVAFTLLAIVVSKVGWGEIAKHLKEISPLEGLSALILATIAQYFSALRMRYFFTAAGYAMSTHFAVVLYYVGAFYNFLLPGGIGGDAYKVILVRKRLEMPAMQGVRIMVADRASGLCIVLLTLFGGLYFCGFGDVVPYGTLLLLLATCITPFAYVICSKKLLKMLGLDMVGSLRYSVIAQLFWMGTLAMLWHAIGHGEHLIAYITLYCAASIASLIPVSVGGLGLREMTYFYGAGLMQKMVGLDVNADIGIAISLCMFAITFISSLPGLLWMNKASKAEIAITPKPQPIMSDSYARTRDSSQEEWN